MITIINVPTIIILIILIIIVSLIIIYLIKRRKKGCLGCSKESCPFRDDKQKNRKCR